MGGQAPRGKQVLGLRQCMRVRLPPTAPFTEDGQMVPNRRRAKKKASRRRKEFVTICERHGRIEGWAEEIEEAANDTNIKLLQLRKLVKKLASKIHTEVNIAADAGQSMENRLSLYKDGIEGMGFVRKKE